MADLDLAELRRLAEAAGGFALDASEYLTTFAPDVVLAVLDRLEAAEAREEAYRSVAIRYMDGDTPVDSRRVGGTVTWALGREPATDAEVVALVDLWRAAGDYDPDFDPLPAVPGAVAGEPGGEQHGA